MAPACLNLAMDSVVRAIVARLVSRHREWRSLRSARSIAHADVMRLSVHLLAALALCLPLAALASDPPLRVVDSVDLNRYAGRWYEAARFPNKFQDQCTGDVVVHYALSADGRIDVVNQLPDRGGHRWIRRAASRARPATGRATRGWRCASRRRSCRSSRRCGATTGSSGSDRTTPGPSSEHPSREHLWILSRTPGMSASSYDRAIEIARGNGFDVTRLVKTTNDAGLSELPRRPPGQVTPVPPSPQYPSGFFDRYCW